MRWVHRDLRSYPRALLHDPPHPKQTKIKISQLSSSCTFVIVLFAECRSTSAVGIRDLQTLGHSRKHCHPTSKSWAPRDRQRPLTTAALGDRLWYPQILWQEWDRGQKCAGKTQQWGFRGYMKTWGFLPTALVLGIYSWALSSGITLGLRVLYSAGIESGLLTAR